MLFLIGHRGVGKTSLIKSIDGGVDLDSEISKKFDIDSFFKNSEEETYRKLEHETLKTVLNDSSVKAVALGAGFLLDSFRFPEGSKVIWVQRRSDSKGRIFLDRPRLNNKVNALDEYLERFPQRESMYERFSDLKIEMEEGFIDETCSIIKQIARGDKVGSAKAYYTLTSPKELPFLKEKVELRTDLFTESEILSVLKENKTKFNFLVAIRTQVSEAFLSELKNNNKIVFDVPYEDWSFYKKYFLNRENIFISSHDKLSFAQIEEALKEGRHLKWAPFVKDFAELKASYSYVEGLDVSFLPRDDVSGRFRWFRQRLLEKNKINFYRTGLSKYLDQPRLVDLDSHFDSAFNGAVLGGDVTLSYSPAFHRSFFSEEFKASYVSISLNEGEFSKENLLFLNKLGFAFFSVTAPFKKDFLALGAQKPANTLAIDSQNTFKSLDTDRFSIESLISNLDSKFKILIWGSGDMGKAVFNLLGSERSKLISVRDYENEPFQGCDALIWCAGLSPFKKPVFKMNPKIIFDLEYKESSKAREVALETGSQYISGKSFFEIQAVAQQKFWKKEHKESV